MASKCITENYIPERSKRTDKEHEKWRVAVFKQSLELIVTQDLCKVILATKTRN